MKAALNRQGQLVTLATLVFAAACTQVLGIDEARVDPGLIPTGSGGSLTGMAGSNSGGLSGGGGTSLVDASTGGGGSNGDDGSNTPPDRDGSGGSNTSDVNVDTGDASSPACTEYCSNIMDYCKDNLKQYLDSPQCLKVCSLFSEGVVGDTTDANTTACRLRYASKARYAAGTERDAYCRKAGPGSDGTCGAICDGFCALMMATCTPKFAPYNFPSSGVCLTTCRALRDVPPYTVADGTLPDRNDAQCRLFHVCSAVMDPDEHCEHAMGVTMCAGTDGSP